MNFNDSYVIKGKCIITISIALIILSIVLFLAKYTNLNTTDYSISLEQINIKNMSTALVAIKKGTSNSTSTTLALTEVTSQVQTLANNPTTTTAQVTQLSNPTVNWRLPTDHGYITQYPRYGHVALDITSNRGTYEAIYPVYDGTIAAMYTDSAGALIIIINHNVNGKNYMSQYVHLSSYASGLYVGKYVTTNDRIGQMGTTGNSTGVHLHLAVLECSYSNDYNCQNLGYMYDFANHQLSTGFYGLQNVMYVPYSWTSR